MMRKILILNIVVDPDLKFSMIHVRKVATSDTWNSRPDFKFYKKEESKGLDKGTTSSSGIGLTLCREN